MIHAILDRVLFKKLKSGTVLLNLCVRFLIQDEMLTFLDDKYSYVDLLFLLDSEEVEELLNKQDSICRVPHLAHLLGLTCPGFLVSYLGTYLFYYYHFLHKKKLLGLVCRRRSSEFFFSSHH